MRRVYKYPLIIDDTEQLLFVQGANARVVSVAVQDGTLCVWIEQDIMGLEVVRKFRVHGTGHYIDHDLVWCGTAHAPPHVWHVYSNVKWQ